MENIISDKAIEEVMTRIDALATKLGVTAEYLFGVYVKQAYIEFISYMSYYFLYAIFMTGVVIFGKYCIKKFNSEDFNIDSSTGIPLIVAFILICVGSCIWTGISISYIRDILLCYFNPEYWAFVRILNHIS